MNGLDKALRHFYQTASVRYPLIAAFMRKIYYRRFFNSVKKSIQGKGNRIQSRYSVLSRVHIDIKGNNNRVIFDSGCIINGLSITIIGDNHQVKIGKDCKVNKGGSFRLVDADGVLSIGERTTIENIHIAVTENNSKVVIGKDCMLSYDIDLRTGDSHAIFDIESGERINGAKDIIIGDHVWIAAHSVILKGVHLPDNSIVATGSIVTRSFETEKCGIIIAGNPAVKIKSGIYWSRER